MTFTDLRLAPELVAALAKQQITLPTPIQLAALPVLLEGRDAYLHAQTGTGKTLGYLLPIFSRLDAPQATLQAVILAPTHELAVQIHRQCCDLAQDAGWPIRTVLLIGGTSTDRQIEKLKKKPQVIVGSPGRIAELIERGKVKTKDIRSVVVDEADRLLDEESAGTVRAIIQAAPLARQLNFASATLEPACTAILAELAPAMMLLQAGRGAVNENIEHLYVLCEERDKPDELRRLLHALDAQRALVFVHRNDLAQRLSAKLAHHHIEAADLNAALDKQDRKRAMDGLRSGNLRVLIASDIAARGLDIKGITHVFNFDVPTSSQGYLHRAGRTGRAGAKGLVVSLVTDIEARVIPRYREELGIHLQRVQTRGGRVVSCETAAR